MAKVRNALQLEGTVWYAQPIASMSTIAREWAALHRTERVPVLRTILSGQVHNQKLCTKQQLIVNISEKSIDDPVISY